jgi:hypothetical protein
MLHIVANQEDRVFSLLNQDPVRPSIPVTNRIGESREVFALMDGDKVAAISCVSYQGSIPTTEQELFCSNGNIAVFYTIWSYIPGTAGKLLFEIVDHIKEKRKIERFVTLSPRTAMARKFHLRNGAAILQENEQTVNFEYKV